MQIFKAKIYHTRFSPVKNSFSYNGFYIVLNIDDLKKEKFPKLFSLNGFSLFSFMIRDHGYRDDNLSLRLWAIEQLKKAGLKHFNGTIELLTLPRVLGFVFNPVSFWYCWENEKLVAVIAEVNNTFGESHNYIVLDPLNNIERPMKKKFHVSPFYPVQGDYRFHFGRKNHVSIKYNSPEGEFIAGIVGEPMEMTKWIVPKIFFRFPFYTLWIVFLIHLQALFLYWKKVPFFKKPKPPRSSATSQYCE